ncbi:MAG: acyl-CoA synthetase [Gammaproteobacteria bacterium]|nr:MAG: acyl-CoA synthetase [Gammaproteobacteria bacterium]
MDTNHRQVYRQELSPVSFLERAGEVYHDRIAVEDGEVSYTWKEFRARARKFASALRLNGLKKDDRVAFLAFNSEPPLLAHFAVPMAGGVLVPINTRLSPQEVAYIVEQSGSSIIFYHEELKDKLAGVSSEIQKIEVGQALEGFLDQGSDDELESWLVDEYDLISINYTSGTTGRPKGVMFHHRGAYLNALGMVVEHQLRTESRYLWTLPMFHCNGWTFPWALAAAGARSICIPKIDPPETWQLFDQGVTHFCAAPTVLIMLTNDSTAHRLQSPVRLFTAGAPPSPTLIEKMQALNFTLDHVYGLTETYGPFTMNIPPENEAALSQPEQAKLKARQGFINVCGGKVDVVDEQLRSVPMDGKTMGEVVMQGNNVMKGYFDDPEATAAAFQGGVFHSGDIAVKHSDGSIELRDRKKDIIISGGENISTVEVEQAIMSYSAVMECAVVAVPHEKWGEVPKAFVTLKPGQSSSAEEIIQYCRSQLAAFKAPRSVEFCELPKTSTGKIQKYVLREKEWQGKEKRIN